MSNRTAIPWTEATWNPTRGCSRISAGCQRCYAERMAHRFSGRGRPFAGLTRSGPSWTGKVRLVPEALDLPLRWKRPRRIFVDSMSDLFHGWVPDEFIDRVFAVMALTQRHCYQLLTKRPDRMAGYIADAGQSIERLEHPAREMGYSLKFQGRGLIPWPLPNVCLGYSASTQKDLDAGVGHLARTPAALRFLSLEPLIEPLDLERVGSYRGEPLSALEEVVGHVERSRVDWVIVGGESGPGARPCEVEWIRSIVRQCKAARVPCFVKQLGANVRQNGIGMHVFFDDRKGADPSEWPKDLRVREFPEVKR